MICFCLILCTHIKLLSITQDTTHFILQACGSEPSDPSDPDASSPIETARKYNQDSQVVSKAVILGTDLLWENAYLQLLVN